jgi:PST family polysaccharide transporter
VGVFIISRLERPLVHASLSGLAAQWREMATLGAALTAATISILCGQLAIRVLVQRSLGLEGVGFFQANFSISVNYIGLSLGALSTDYFPRLVPHVEKPTTLRELVNGQALVSLLLATPLIVIAIGFAPIVMNVLYSPSFRPAAAMLGWQMLGDLMRIAGWPLSFILLASGRGTVFALNEAAAVVIGVVMTALLVPKFGIAGAGMAYLVMNAAYLFALTCLVRQHTGWVWERRTATCWLAGLGWSITALLLSRLNAYAGMAVSMVGAAWLSANAWRQLHEALPAKLGRLLGRPPPDVNASGVDG